MSPDQISSRNKSKNSALSWQKSGSGTGDGTSGDRAHRRNLAASRADKLAEVVRRSRDYKLSGQKFRHRDDLQATKIEGESRVNRTTMAEWQRVSSPDAIQAQLAKLQALRIEKLNIDLKIADSNYESRPAV